MKSSKRCLRQVRINMICLTSESLEKQSTHGSVKRKTTTRRYNAFIHMNLCRRSPYIRDDDETRLR